jgi:hypothetical protein
MIGDSTFNFLKRYREIFKNKYYFLLLRCEVKQEMPLMITYYNLKDGVREDEFVKKTKELFESAKKAGFGSPKFYRHHLIGANNRLYQMHVEFVDLGAWDRFSAIIEKDEKLMRLADEVRELMDFKTHYDETLLEITL